MNNAKEDPMHRLLSTFRAVYKNNTDNLENALDRIKMESASVRDAVYVVAKVLSIPLYDAHEIVLNSKTWNFMKGPTGRLHNQIDETLSHLNYRKTSDDSSDDATKSKQTP